jgi:hypothetical protein
MGDLFLKYLTIHMAARISESVIRDYCPILSWVVAVYDLVAMTSLCEARTKDCINLESQLGKLLLWVCENATNACN